MDDVNVIVRPLITEKTAHFASARNAYTFEVNSAANKAQIRNAVERLYNVRVHEVRTSNYRGKPRRKGRQMGYTTDWKKAVVVLDKDHHIDLF